MIEPHDLPDRPWGRTLPAPVIDLLIDLGDTANEAVFLLNEALLIDRRVASGQSDERSTGRPGNARLRMRERARAVVLNYSDEMVAVYADAAGQYARTASSLARILVTGGAVEPWWSLLPVPMSVIITEPGTNLPWIEVGTPAGAGQSWADPASFQGHHTEVVAHHQSLVAAINDFRSKEEPTLFDDLGNMRGAASYGAVDDHGVALATALHQYAADCQNLIATLTGN